ncbi:hypothetical protein CN97_02385 [Haematobacter massiliensis]|uniref:DUF4174 domain-containing protein n=1 Tax=Haematobacter massiliensis TaxID=195105 RepID=A0A086XXG2_9RHOB|nr:DUF4174 domain-containing protein [Haematobacter massiliensis]KFI26712.1 hypothetical protein CN97_02385 [Haematobacter massiliensis]
MNRIATVVLAALLATPLLAGTLMAETLTAPVLSTEHRALAAGTGADPLPAEGVKLSEFAWTHRPLVIFADSPNDPAYLQQRQMLLSSPEILADREIVVIVDSDPDQRSDLRTRLRPRGFSLVLLDKNGSVLLTRPLPRTVREIAAAVDKTPLRRQELQERRSAPRSQ